MDHDTTELGPDQLRLVEYLTGLASTARQALQGGDVPFAAAMRLRTGGRIRDVLLGDRSMLVGELAIIDWEDAPLAEVFFTASVGDPYEIEVDDRTIEGEVLERAMVEFADGRLVRIMTDDAELSRTPSGAWQARPAAPPVSFERRSPAARARPSIPTEVVLDEAQRRAVELPADQGLLVLGEAGFGKTTVALQRLAWLRERSRASKRKFSSLVLAPTEGLRRLTKAVLERMEIDDAEVSTVDEWLARQARRVFPDLPSRTSLGTPPAVSRLKRHPAVRTVLPDIAASTPAMRETQEEPRKPWATRDELLHLWGDRTLLERIVEASAGALPSYAIKEVLAHTRIQFSETTERAHAHVDADRLKTIDGRPIDERTPMHDADSVDVEDLPVMFELNRLETGSDATPAGALTTYDHVIVDEAQEFAPLELSVIGRAVRAGGTISVAGDERQQVDPTTSFVDWSTTMRELGGPPHERVVLKESYRCPPTVETFARTLFVGSTAPRKHGGAPVLCSAHAHPCHLAAELTRTLFDLVSDDRRATIAVVYRYPEVARRWYDDLARALPVRLALGGDFYFKPGITVTAVEEVRGLEFDIVVVPDVSSAVYPDDEAARKALYVAATRTIHQLWLACSGRWSPLVERARSQGAL